MSGRSRGLDAWLDARRDRFGLLLALLVASFLLTGVDSSRLGRLVGAGLALAALAAGVASTDLGRDRRRLAVVGGVGAVGVVLLATFEITHPAAAVGALCVAAMLAVVLGAVIARVLGHVEVQVPTILGALAAYFLIGLVFAWVYWALSGLVDGPVLSSEDGELPVYYSFVVLSTLGFGDISPINEFARRLTAVEAITGQIFLVTLVARLVSIYGTSKPAE